MIGQVKYKKLALLFLTLLVFLGCGSGYGIYHGVRPGETFQMICKAYGLNEESVANFNYIPDTSKVKAGDAIWISGAERELSAREIKSPSSNNTSKIKANRKKTVLQKKSPPVSRSAKGAFQWPLQGDVFSKFGNTNGEVHDGIDIRAGIGDEIRASAGGRVIYSGNDIKSYGHMVIIKHEGRFSSVYAHNKKNLVEKGSFIKEGEVIALVGDSGISNGPSLHFEIREGKKAVNPLSYLP
ncbi:MAG: peptidoglycan DD-metalloendopeptidase family protein [Proteobacteria bacterium]|nr:peptidoglycan DD-metalloendopeptidase family protein [Pseudomonadota bacterium]